MVRTCSVVGCSSTAGLHVFPAGAEIRRYWLHVIGVGENCKLPPRSGVCDRHFTPDSYSNFSEVSMGFAKQLRLTSEAVPTVALPPPPGPMTPPAWLHPGGSLRKMDFKGTREIGCQTEPVHSKHETVQAYFESASSKASLRASCPPLKRKRCEMSAYNPSVSSVDSTSAPIKVPAHKQKKYIVHEENLLELFQTCPMCTRHCIVDTTAVGTLLQVKQQCPTCEFSNEWCSQPMVNNIPAGNLQLCASVLFTGSSFHQIEKFLVAFNVQGMSEQSFHRHRTKLLIPTISWQWKLDQEALITKAIAGGAVTLGGDMRADSPGHSSKYGSYTMMNLNSSTVIDVQLVQSNKVGNVVGMEEEAFVRSLSMLEEKGLKVEAIVTDGHTGVQRFLKEKKQGITHLCHTGKGIGKKMKLGKKRLLKRRTVNHLYCSASTSSSGEEVVAKWTSVADHVQNVNNHDNFLFPNSLHEPQVGQKAPCRLKPSTAACEKLSAILLSPRFVKNVSKLSPQHHTSAIKAFHRLILRFSPQSVAYSFKEMSSRLKLAAMHYNENATRPHAVTATGELQYPKYKPRDYTVQALKIKPTQFYIDKLMALLFEHIVVDPESYQKHSDLIPEPVCALFERPEKQEAVSKQRSTCVTNT